MLLRHDVSAASKRYNGYSRDREDDGMASDVQSWIWCRDHVAATMWLRAKQLVAP
jgi:DNA/RNA endonuclease YhcR with UshA esterase domain